MGDITRRSTIGGAGALAALGLAGAPALRAQVAGWPAKPIKFIVPLAPGGGLDFIARLTGEFISRPTGLGQQVVIENRTGAGGTIGIDAAMKSAPDGYTVLVTNDNVASAPSILRLSIDYGKELIPVIFLARQPQCFAAHPSLGVNSISELVQAVKAQPGLGCATSGVGSNQHVLMEWFSKLADIRLDHVPYRGAGQAINDLVAGHVKVGCLGPTAVTPHYRAGTLRMLAQTGEARSPSLPEVPTLQEVGYAGCVLEGWYAAFVPLATPPAIVAGLNAEMNKAMADAASRDSLLKTATEPVGGPPERLMRLMEFDTSKYARLVKELNIHTN
jgi:tripartite-type tricarboxylate transporter receptor subunit TctC